MVNINKADEANRLRIQQGQIKEKEDREFKPNREGSSVVATLQSYSIEKLTEFINNVKNKNPQLARLAESIKNNKINNQINKVDSKEGSTNAESQLANLDSDDVKELVNFIQDNPNSKSGTIGSRVLALKQKSANIKETSYVSRKTVNAFKGGFPTQVLKPENPIKAKILKSTNAMAAA